MYTNQLEFHKELLRTVEPNGLLIPYTNSRSKAIILRKSRANSEINSEPRATKEPRANSKINSKLRAINSNSNAERIDPK